MKTTVAVGIGVSVGNAVSVGTNVGVKVIVKVMVLVGIRVNVAVDVRVGVEVGRKPSESAMKLSAIQRQHMPMMLPPMTAINFQRGAGVAGFITNELYTSGA